MRVARWRTRRIAEISAYRGERKASVANGIGAKLARLARRLSEAPGRAAAKGGRPGDCAAPGALRRTHHGSMEREMMEKALVSDSESAAVAALASPEPTLLLRITLAAYARLHGGGGCASPGHERKRPQPGSFGAPHAAGEGEARHSVGSSSGPLQRRGAIPRFCQRAFSRARYNRFLGGASELPASELARALAANGRDTLTLLLTSTGAARETVVGEARVALSCAERAGGIRYVDCR